MFGNDWKGLLVCLQLLGAYAVAASLTGQRQWQNSGGVVVEYC